MILNFVVHFNIKITRTELNEFLTNCNSAISTDANLCTRILCLPNNNMVCC